MEVIAQLNVHMIGLITSTPIVIDRSQPFISVIFQLWVPSNHTSNFMLRVVGICIDKLSRWYSNPNEKYTIEYDIMELLFYHAKPTRCIHACHAMPLLRDVRTCDTRMKKERKPFFLRALSIE